MIGEGFGGLQAHLGHFAAGEIGVGDGDDARLRHLEPDGVKAVPVVALPRMTDDGDADGGWRRGGVEQRGRSRGKS